MEETIDNQALKTLYPHMLSILKQAQSNNDKFTSLSKENKTTNPLISYRSLCIWLISIQTYIRSRTKHTKNYQNIVEKLTTKEGIKRALSLVKLFQIIMKREKNPRKPLLGIYPNITTIYNSQTQTEKRKRLSKKGRSIELNGVSAMDITLRKHTNLSEPILDLQIILNNPIGRLWLAIKRIWKSQHTIITLRFSIPLLVLPILIFVLWTLWRGGNVSIPFAKVGQISLYKEKNEDKYIFVLPNNDIYFLKLPNENFVLPAKTDVVISGFLHTQEQEVAVEEIIELSSISHSSLEIKKQTNPSFFHEVFTFLQMFY